jgi:hypothetical protein
MEIPIQSTWGKAVVLLLAAGAVVYGLISRPVDTEAEKAIHAHLRHGGYMRHALKTFQDAGGLQAEDAEARAQDLLETAKAELEIVSARARGPRKEPVVRVEFLVDGRPPEGEEPVKYLVMQRSLTGGWRVRSETTAFDYYLP